MDSSTHADPLTALAGLARSVRAVRRDATQLGQDARIAARNGRAIAAWSRSLPRLTVHPSDDAVGDDVLQGLADHQPWPFRHRAVATITLPSTFEAYLRGRSKQAVRTGRHHALDLGVTVSTPAPAPARLMLGEMLARHSFPRTIDARLAHQVSAGRSQIWFATTADGSPSAMAAVAVDRRTAHLALLQVGLDVPDRSAVRYLLSTEVIRGLIEQRVGHLLADSMLLASPGVVHLQRRLGFEPMNIVVPRRRRHRPVGAAADLRDAEGLTSDAAILSQQS